MVIQIIIAFLFILLLDLKELLKMKGNKTRVFIVYGLLLFSGFIISYLLAVDKAPTSPAIFIEKTIKLILGR